MRDRLSVITAVLAASPILVAAGLAGCQGFGEDLGDLANSLTPTSPSEAARMAVNYNDADARREGIVLLSNASFGGLEIYVNLYRDAASMDTDPLVRAAAVNALARHGMASDAIVVAANLQHDNKQVRWEAAKGLQRLHDPAVVPAILVVLRDRGQDSDIRAELARTLGQYPEDRVFQALLAALDERELGVNIAAHDSLRTLTGQDYGIDPVEWLAWYDRMLDAGSDPFSNQVEFQYPTYSRDLSLFEKMAFWNPVIFEQPGTPAGLAPAGSRTTYDDSETSANAEPADPGS